MILQKIKKSIEKIGIPCFLDYNDATSYCAVLIPETNGKESIKVDIQFIWEDGNPILLADEWIKSLRMNKELKVIVLGSENNYAGYVLRVKVIDVSICSYIPTGNRYTITIVNDPSKGTATGDGMYKEGKTCTLTDTPNEQYYFVGWLTPDDDVVHDNPYSFTVDRDATYETYYLSKYHVVVQSSGNGTVSGSGYYEPTETCTITATPNTGYHFVNWTVNDLELTTDNPYSFIPTGDITITANFIPYYDISVSSSGNGTVSGGGTYNSGETVSLTATPNEGYVFLNWTENGVEVSTSNPYTFTSTENRTIVGNFDEFSAPLVINTLGSGSTVVLKNSNNQEYTLNLVDGENVYEGNVPGFALNEITGLKRSSNPRNIISIDAIGLTSWTTVESMAFFQSGLESITLPNTITTIASDAFYYCSLTSITLPASITSIGNNAFNSNSNCQNITCLATTPPTLGNNAFDNTNNCLIYVPVDSVNDYKTAWTTYASRIVGNIPEPAEDNLFVECKNTSSVILTNSSNQTYTWNLSTGKNYYTGTEPGFAINEITGLKRGNSLQNNITYIDASDLTSWITIDSDAFNNCQGLTSIILPNSLTTLADNVFSGCSKLTSITFPDSLTTIKSDVFANCHKLESLHIPANVNSIAQRIGYALQSLASITVDPNNVKYSDGNGGNCLIENNKLILGSINAVIPNNITYISGFAFYYIPISSITLPDSLTTIESYAFGNTGLTSINIPANVSYIGTGAFSSCYNLASITVDSNNTTYNDGNGGNCIIESATNKLITGCNYTTIPNTVVALEDNVFSGCKFTSIILPSSLTTIGDNAFSNTSLTSINIPANVNYIGNSAFWSYLWYIEFEGTTPATLQTTSIFLGNYPIYVPSSAVNDYKTAWPTYASRIQATPEPTGNDYLRIDTSNSTSVILTNSSNQTYTWNLEESGIHYYNGDVSGFAINEITGLKKSTGDNIDNRLGHIDASKLTSWITIENNAFRACNYLTSIILPNSLTTIGNNAFYYCSSRLESITLPNSITTIGDSVFYHCDRLTSLTLSDSLISLGSSAISICQRLTSITLPSTLTSIGDEAFSGSQGLTSITCLATTPPTLGGNNVFNQTGNCPIYVPAASVNDYKTAQYWSTYASRIQAIPTP